MSRKNWLIFMIAIFFIGALIFVKIFLNSNQTIYKDFSIIHYQLQKKSYKLLVADTSQKWERGLMFYRSLPGVDGMIFLFPDSQVRNFWNKNTLMDLRLLWINHDQLIGTSDLPSIEKSGDIVLVTSPGPADKVIELPK